MRENPVDIFWNPEYCVHKLRDTDEITELNMSEMKCTHTGISVYDNIWNQILANVSYKLQKVKDDF
jgi:hypothetical protein